MSAKRTKRNKKEATIMIRLSEPEKQRFEKAADIEDRYLAEIIRELIREYADRILGEE